MSYKRNANVQPIERYVVYTLKLSSNSHILCLRVTVDSTNYFIYCLLGSYIQKMKHKNSITENVCGEKIDEIK